MALATVGSSGEGFSTWAIAMHIDFNIPRVQFKPKMLLESRSTRLRRLPLPLIGLGVLAVEH